jgi:predicted nucleic acid-binding protein
MSAKAFIDTNVLVYLFDSRVPAKQQRAAQLFEQLATADDAPTLSTQVLQEAFVALTRKLLLEAKEALSLLQALEQTSFAIQPIHAPLIWRAAERLMTDKLSFWDALIVEAALEAGCTILYSEDFQEGRSYGSLTVSNPFH